MLKYEQSLLLKDTDKETALALACQAMKNLEWDILLIEAQTLTGSTLKTPESNRQQMECRIDGSKLIITSKMTGIEMVDNASKNRKNTEEFIEAFEKAKTSATPDEIEYYKNAVTTLRGFVGKAYKHREQPSGFRQAVKLTLRNLYVTYGIILINVIVFILMALTKSDSSETDGLLQIKWGSNYSPLTLSGEWWRLFTSTFIHFNLSHLAVNMLFLYGIGVYLEPLLGKAWFIIAYVFTGISASILSLWWHKHGINSAGASGAIFGLYGIFFALLTTNLVPKNARQVLFLSIGLFIVYNLVYGIRGNTDNAAHIGGLISGFVFAYFYIYSKKENKQEM